MIYNNKLIMKKVLVLIAATSMLVGMITSCNPCVECTKKSTGASSSIDFCKDDLDSRKEYKDAIKGFEDEGFTCTKK